MKTEKGGRNMEENVVLTTKEVFFEAEEKIKRKILGTVILGELVEIHFISPADAKEHSFLCVTA